MSIDTNAPSRRAVLAAAAASALAASAPSPGQDDRKVKLGVIGNGGRGAWIAGLFARNGGYTMHAVADYFPEVAAKCGDALGVDAGRRFSGLGGYKRLIESGVEAVALEAPPCFYAEHARAAVEAGLHVYMAKPVAADVPGAKSIEATAKRAGEKGLTFLVDYQMPTDATNIEIVKRIRAGAIGEVAGLNSQYLAGAFPDPAPTANLESRLRGLIWVNDTAIGSGYHGNACIHAIQSAMWVAGSVPIAASGASRLCRANPHGDSHDFYSISFEFPGGLVLNHRAKHMNDRLPGYDFCACLVHGTAGSAYLAYSGSSWIVSDNETIKEEVPNLYEAGAVRNIAEFRRCVLAGDHSNPTVRYAVDSCLATILGREAALKRTRITMRELLARNKALRIDTRGLRE